jgi:hypothetical protein
VQFCILWIIPHKLIPYGCRVTLRDHNWVKRNSSFFPQNSCPNYIKKSKTIKIASSFYNDSCKIARREFHKPRPSNDWTHEHKKSGVKILLQMWRHHSILSASYSVTQLHTLHCLSVSIWMLFTCIFIHSGLWCRAPNTRIYMHILSTASFLGRILKT